MSTINSPSKRNNDFISSLPNSILHHILGFLMTEEAVSDMYVLEKFAILQNWTKGEEGASTNELTNLSSTIAASSYKKLKIVEVKYYKYNQMVRQLVNTLMDGTKEFENLKIHSSKYKYWDQYLS